MIPEAIKSLAKDGLDYTDSLVRLLGTTARPLLNIKFPKEFELYMCALELVDQEGSTLRYFVFPIMPSNIEESQPQLTNIKKTMGGITVLSNPTFIPSDITLSGNFGRKFRALLGTDYIDFISSFKTNLQKINLKSITKGTVTFFDERIKTGYGCCKILEDIVRESKLIDDAGVKHLIFHNPALGNSYVVKPMNLKFSMSQETNMIWSYSLNLKTIATLEAFKNSTELSEERERLTVTGMIQDQTNRVVSLLSSIF